MTSNPLARMAKRAAGAARRRWLRRLPLEALERRLPRAAVAFMYHAISDQPLPHLTHLYQCKTVAEFEADVIYLKARYRLPRWQDFLEDSKSGRLSDRPNAFITFDDGMAECFHFARPILLKHQVPCLFFVAKAFIDNKRLFYRHKVSLCLEQMSAFGGHDQSDVLSSVGRAFGSRELSLGGFRAWLTRLEIVDESSIDRVCELVGVDTNAVLVQRQPYMTSSQAIELSREGFTIGGHSLCHGRLQLLAPSAQAREIVDSCTFVRDLVGSRDVPFAFPFGGLGLDRQHLAAVVGQQPWIGFLFDTGSLTQDAPFIIHRMSADEPAGVPAGRSGLEGMIRSHYLETLTKAAGQDG